MKTDKDDGGLNKDDEDDEESWRNYEVDNSYVVGKVIKMITTLTTTTMMIMTRVSYIIYTGGSTTHDLCGSICGL